MDAQYARIRGHLSALLGLTPEEAVREVYDDWGQPLTDPEIEAFALGYVEGRRVLKHKEQTCEST